MPLEFSAILSVRLCTKAPGSCARLHRSTSIPLLFSHSKSAEKRGSVGQRWDRKLHWNSTSADQILLACHV